MEYGIVEGCAKVKAVDVLVKGRQRVLRRPEKEVTVKNGQSRWGA